MATCVPNTLIEQNPCYFTLPSQVQAAIGLQLWCVISGAVTPPGGVEGWFNPDVGAPIYNPDTPGVIDNPDV